MTISGRKRQICKRTLNFLPISTRPQWICKFLCRIFLRKNFQVLKNHQKAKIWGCWTNCLFCFVYFLLKKFNDLISFWYYLEELLQKKALKLNKTKKLKNRKSARIVAQIFEFYNSITKWRSYIMFSIKCSQWKGQRGALKSGARQALIKFVLSWRLTQELTSGM